MRRDKISIRYRQVSILRRWSITTLSRHQLLRDELCFIFCYRLNVAKRRCRHCSQQRIAEKENVGNCERAYIDVTHESREHECGDNSVCISFFFVFLALLYSRAVSEYFGTLPSLLPTCSLWRICLHCTAHTYVCMYYMYNMCNCRYAHEQCSRLRENDFTVWRNFKLINMVPLKQI